MSRSIFRAFLSIGIAVSMAFAMLPAGAGLTPRAAYASEDSIAPVLNGFAVLNPTVERPDTVQLRLLLTEEGSGISDMSLSLKWNRGAIEQNGSISMGLEYGGAGGSVGSNFSISLDSSGKQFGDYTGEYIVNLGVGQDADISDYTITSLWIRDKEGNQGTYDLDSLRNVAQGGLISFAVQGDSGGEDYSAPVIKSFQVLGSPAARPGEIKMLLDIDEPDSGFSDVSVSCAWLKRGTPQSGSISMGLEYGGAGGDMCSNFQISLDPSSKKFGEKSGRYVITLSFGERANVSTYTVTEIWVRDKAGNERRYPVSLLQALAVDGKSSFEIAGDDSSDDFEAPKLASFEILTPVVNRPGIMKLKLNVVEEGSGLSDIDISTSWLKNGRKQDGSISMGLEYGGAGGDMCSNFQISLDPSSKKFGEKSGSYIVSLTIGPRADLSTYSIDRIWLRDRFGNTTEVGSYGYSGDEANPLIGLAAKGDNTFDLKDEFTYSFTTGTNNPTLATQLATMPEGMAAKVECVGEKVLKKACLDVIKGKDKTIVVYDDGLQWVIRGKSLTGTTKDLRLGVTCSKVSAGTYYQNPYSSAASSSADTSTNGYGEAVWTVPEDTIKLEFYPNGSLPGPMQVRFKSDYLYDRGISGKTPSLYFLNGDSLVLENGNCDLNFDGTDKWCYVTVTHNSTFAVTPAKQAPLSKTALAKHKATFKNNGKTVKILERTNMQSLGKLPVITKKGYLLKGWYTKKSGGKKATTATKITSNKTYYAQWVKDSPSAASSVVNDVVAAKSVKITAKAAQSCKVAKQNWKKGKLKKAVSQTIKLTKYKNVAVKSVAIVKNSQGCAKYLKLSKVKNGVKITLKKGYPKKVKSIKFKVELKNGNTKSFTLRVR